MSGKLNLIEKGLGKMFSFLLLLRALFTMTPRTGAIRMNTTFREGRLGLTHKRPSYQPTGTHLSPRSVLV